MPKQIVFPCPHCGASQNVADDVASTVCQFCGNSISVPEELRPKAPEPQPLPMPQTFALGALPGMAGMPGVPSMFLNMDIGKLRAMAMAARAGDKTEAARLYGETFGVSPEEAMQAADLMSSHHHLVLGQMQMSTPVIQLGSAPPAAPYSMPSPTYNLPSPPVVSSGQGTGGRWAACFAVAILLLIAVVIAGAVVAAAVLRAR